MTRLSVVLGDAAEVAAQTTGTATIDALQVDLVRPRGGRPVLDSADFMPTAAACSRKTAA